MRRANHGTAYANAQVVTDALQRELEKGRLHRIDSLPPHYYCSPIGLVPKRSDGVHNGWHVIFDLSCPDGRSVNDGIPKEYGTIVYEPLTVAIGMVAKAGRNAVMMKRDLKSAFRHIPVSPEDYWCLIFEWQGQFYVDLFLPFGLRTSPRIFNLFSEAIHWVLEQLEWSVSHYLDDFFTVFPPGSDATGPARIFDEVLNSFGLSKAPEKDECGTIVTHLGFEFDSARMEVQLPPNKLKRAQQAVDFLLAHKSVSQSSLEEILGFLSHCCQVVPLGRPFLRQLFSLLRRKARYRRSRLNSSARADLRWWQLFLSHWSSISLVQLSRRQFDVSTDASGLKGIGGLYDGRIFASRVPSHHQRKHINWKEMFAVLHALILWHKEWIHGSVDVACDNTAVVNGINNRSIRGPSIRPLRTLLLIAAVLDIEIKAHWIPTKENIVADAASRHDFRKLANLGFKDQVTALRNRPSPPIKTSALRQQLSTFFNSRSRLPQERTTGLFRFPMKPSVLHTGIRPTRQQSQLSRTGLHHLSQPQSELPQSKAILTQSNPTTPRKVGTMLHSATHASNSLSKVQSDTMEKESAGYACHSQRIFSKGSFHSSPATETASISGQPSAQVSQVFSAQESSPGIHGILTPPPDAAWQESTYSSTQTARSFSPCPRRKQTHLLPGSTSTLQRPPRRASALPPPYARSSRANRNLQTHPHSAAQPALSRKHISSTKSENIYSKQESRRVGTPDTHFGKVQQSLQLQKVFPEKILNCSADGRATQSTSTSTKFPNPPWLPIHFL